MAENWPHASVHIRNAPALGWGARGRDPDRARRPGDAGLVAGEAALAIGLAGGLARGRIAARSSSPTPGVVAIMLAVGFWLFFVAMAWRDYAVLYKWPETTGTIVGRHITVQTTSSKGGTATPRALAARICKSPSLPCGNSRWARDALDRL